METRVLANSYIKWINENINKIKFIKSGLCITMNKVKPQLICLV